MQYKLIHSCGQVAFYINNKPELGSKIILEDITLLNGTTPVVGDKRICGSCGQELKNKDFHPVLII